MKLGVVLVLVLVAGCGGSSTQQGVLPGRAPAEVPGPDGGAGVDSGADHIAAAADATGAPAAEVGAPAQDAAPAAPDAEVFPTCAEIGFVQGGLRDCEEPGTAITGRRTAGHQYSCATCTTPAGANAPRVCVAKPDSTIPPWVCVPSCSVCPVLLGAGYKEIFVDAGAGG